MQTNSRRRSPVHVLGLCVLLLAITMLACATFRAPGDPAPTRPPTLTLVPTATGTATPTLTPTATSIATLTLTTTPSLTATLPETRPALTRTTTAQPLASATPSSSAQ
ncbi:MAG: hypothetical protein AB1435_09280 [Chloroflexota bacterium]